MRVGRRGVGSTRRGVAPETFGLPFRRSRVKRSGAWNGAAGPPPRGSLLRIANRPDLYPDKLLRFRTPAGDFAQQFIKDLSESDVTEDEHGAKTVSFELDEDPGSSWRVWACTLTRDGIPCESAGPWRLLVPAG